MSDACRSLLSLPTGCHSRSRAVPRGYVLAEAMLCLAIVAMAALPLSLLAIKGLGAIAEQRVMLAVASVTADAAEYWNADSGSASGVHQNRDMHDVRLLRCESLSADGSCAPGTRLVVGESTRPSRLPAADAPVPRVALWVTP